MEQNEVKQLDQKKVVWIVLAITGVVIALLAGIYIYISSYFTDHFHLGSKIGAIDVSGMTAEEANAALQKTMNGYKLTIKKSDGSVETITASDVNLGFQWQVSPTDYLKKQNGYEWIVKKFKPDSYKMQSDVSFDEGMLADKIAKLEALQSENQIPAKDATVSEYNKDTGYTLVPSVPGTVVNVENFSAKVKECIYALEDTMDMTEGNIYVEPVVKDDNEKLLAAITALNNCLKAKITYQVGNKTQVLDASTFQPWISLDGNLEVVVDDAAVTTYVKNLASTYNTCYSAKKFMTSYNKEITITNSHYGWKVDNAAEKAAIISQIKSGTAITRDLKYSMTANSRGPQDYGNSYVEINLTAQHLFVYVDGKCVVESDFVSGNESKGWNTPTGIWGLTYKTRNATLRGDGYATPVSYWMPYAGNVGMHDATWRSDFGGNYYKTSGSHGCVNLPLASAKAIYSYIRSNFPVIVYKLDGTESEKGIAMDQANAMDKAINAIGTVTLKSEAKIVACREQYDALSDLAKKYVKKYQTLVNAEKALEKLKTPEIQ